MDQTELRAKIQEIRRDASLTAAEKGRAIQQLMSRRRPTTTAEKQEEKDDDEEKPPEEDPFAPSYADEENKVLGCKHYMRACKLRCAECARVFVCRLCHDEALADDDDEQANAAATAAHRFPRHATTHVLCMLCRTEQPVAAACAGCGARWATYFCAVCRFYDSTSAKAIYHCPHCGLCRLGKGLGDDGDMAHCDTCGCCMRRALYAEHRCVRDVLQSSCVVCRDDAAMATSVKPVSLLHCGHGVHTECLNAYFASNYKCPLCAKSALPPAQMAPVWEQIEAQIELNSPMPEEYRVARVDVFCNDCETLTERVPFHFVAHRCGDCLGYNTRVEKMYGMPATE